MKAKGKPKSGLNKSSLIQLLKSLSKQEMKAFDKFVRSPFHNNRSEVTRYFMLLKKYYPAFDHGDFNKEKIYKKLYPGKPFRDDVIRRLGTNLKSLIEGYLTYKNFSSSIFEKKLGYVSTLFERNLDSLLEKELLSCDSILEERNISPFYFNDRMQLEIQKHNFFDSRKKTKLMIRSHVDGFESLFYYFLSSLGFSLCANIIYEKRMKEEYSSPIQSAFLSSFDADKLMNEIKKNPTKENILVLSYYYLYRALQNPEDEYSQSIVVELLREHSGKLTRTTNYNIYTAIMNIYAGNVVNGKFNYYRKQFELYKEMISKNVLVPIDSMYVDIYDFINIVGIAAGLKELQWGEWFVKEYINSTHPDERADILNFCNASFAYYRKDYDKALGLIVKVNFDYIKVYTKILLCKIYYDMEYTDQLFSLIDSFRHYLNNDKKVPKGIKENYSKFILHLKELANIKLNTDFDGLQILKKKILIGPYDGVEWFSEKIEELEKGN